MTSISKEFSTIISLDRADLTSFSFDLLSRFLVFNSVPVANVDTVLDVSFASVDDAYEENDSLFTAFDLSGFEGTPLSSISGLGVQADADWYEIEITEGFENLVAVLDFVHAAGDLDLFLYDAGGNLVTQAVSVTDDEILDVILPSAGTYYLEVNEISGDATFNTYDLVWDDLLVDDAYEENDTLFTAFDLSGFEGMPLSSINGLGVQADADWYEIEITPGFENLVAVLDFVHAAGDLDLFLYDAGGNLVTQSISVTDDEILDVILPSAGTYYLEVNEISGDATFNTYDLVWDDLLVDDAYEENDTLFTAFDLSGFEGTPLSSINGLGVQADADWYEIEITEGFENLVASLDFVHADGDLDLFLYDAAGNLVTQAISVTDDEILDVILPSAGTYYLEVNEISGDATFNTYDLVWDDLLVDDAYEENDTLFTAFDLSGFEGTPLSSISGLGVQADADWYEIEITEGFENLVAVLDFVHAAGDLDLFLYDAGGNLVTQAVSVTDDEILDVILPSAGTYYLEVNEISGDATFNTYDLVWDDLLVDDAYEENDTLFTAFDLSGFEGTPLSSIDGLGVQADADWYEIEITEGFENLVASLDFVHADGDLDLFLYDAGGNLVTQSISVTDDEILDVILPSAGTYYLEVNEINGDATFNTYDLVWDDLLVDDAYEENDTLFTAFDLSGFEGTPLSSISGLGVQADADWYEIEITEGFENLVAVLDFVHAAGDLDLFLYDAGGNLVTQAISVTDDEILDVILPSAGTYYLEVNEISGDATFNTYDLVWDDLLVDDAYEENDTLFTAFDLSGFEGTLLSSINGLGVQADADWYEIEITPGFENLVASLDFVHAAGDLDLFLYDAAGNLVTQSISVTDDEFIDILLPSAGTYYLEVNEFNGDATFNTYDLVWDDLLFLEGTPVRDILEGTSDRDTILGLRGDDDIFGLAGNDALGGDRGDDDIFGGLGSDFIDGGRGDDRLSGVDPLLPDAGTGEIDYLLGGYGADVFVLGDFLQVYYDDLNDSDPGIGDYALIQDFEVGQDVIELQGSASDYVLEIGQVGLLGEEGIGILRETPGQTELIAIVQGTDTLNLTDDSFVYV